MLSRIVALPICAALALAAVVAPTRAAVVPREVPAPDDVAAPPEDASWTASGIAFEVLRSGTGDRHPGVNDEVTVDYAVWTTDGTTIDASPEGHPQTMSLNTAIPGLIEALALMVPGERRLFWIPGALAYDGKAGMPQGTLVFDVDLHDVVAGPRPPEHLDAPPASASHSDSGLAWTVLRPGAGGRSPGPGDAATVKLDSWTPDGRLLGSSRRDGAPVKLTFDGTMPGLAEALRTMTPGERRLLWLTPELATVEGGKPPGGPVVVDVELLDVQHPIDPPVSIAAPPPDAVVTPTGLAYTVIEPGEGTRHARYGDTVVIEYAGWTRDGTSFDSSFEHGAPGRFTLDATLPLGLNEALMQMVEGERRVVWIPEDLAYGRRPDRPQGMLVFDLRLLSIEPR